MTDLISRQDAIALLESIIDETCPEAWNGGVEACLEALSNMPSAGVHIELKAAQGSGVYGYSIYKDKP